MIRFLLCLMCTLSFASAEHPLGVSQEIANALDQKGTAVIFGAPGSGKTEQMKSALQGKTFHVFDLRKEFLSVFKGISKSNYNIPLIKAMQADWFLTQREALFDRLITSEADVIVFDEIDLSIGQELNASELLVVLEIVHMAKQLRETGFQVILIIHTSALRNTTFWEAMGSNELIQTRYLTDEEEDYLLDATILTDGEKQAYKSVSQGLPTAYLSMIDYIYEHGKEEKAPYSYVWLIQNAKKRILKNLHVIKSVERPEIFQTLEDLVNAPFSWEDLDPQMLQDLIYSGVVGMKNGTPVIPPLVQILIQ